MTTELALTLAKLKGKQSEITRLHTEFKEKEHLLVLEHKDKVRELESETEAKIAEAARALNAAKETYRAECKAAFGVADGEPINILDVVDLVRRVAE